MVTVAILAQGTNWAVAETQAFLLYFGAVFEPPRGHPDTKRASAITAARLLSAFARARAHCQLARGAMLTGSARQTCCAQPQICGTNLWNQ